MRYLGSLISIDCAKIMKKRGSRKSTDNLPFEKGDFVVAKFGSYPAWPAQISCAYADYATIRWIQEAAEAGRPASFKMKWTAVSAFDPTAEPLTLDADLLAAHRRAARLAAAADAEPTAPAEDGLFDLLRRKTPEVEEEEGLSEGKETSPEPSPGPTVVELTQTLPEDEGPRDMYSSLKGRRQSQKERITDIQERLAPVAAQLKKKLPQPKSSSAKKSRKSEHNSISSSQKLAFADIDEERKFAVGDIIWAKVQRWSHFPSIVLGLGKDGRVSLAFLPLPFPVAARSLTRFRTPPANCVPFAAARQLLWKESGKEEERRAVEQADAILAGHIPKLFRSAEDGDSTPSPVNSEATARYSEEAEQPHTSTNGNSSVPGQASKSDQSEANNGARSSDPASKAGSQNEGPPALAPIESHPAEEDGSLLSVMKSAGAKEFLYSVYRGDTPNARQSEWASLGSGEAMATPPSLGPLRGEGAVEALVERLSLWFQGLEPDASLRSTYAYIVGVWLPEAVKWALRETQGLTEEESEDVLHQEV